MEDSGKRQKYNLLPLPPPFFSSPCQSFSPALSIISGHCDFDSVAQWTSCPFTVRLAFRGSPMCQLSTPFWLTAAARKSACSESPFISFSGFMPELLEKKKSYNFFLFFLDNLGCCLNNDLCICWFSQCSSPFPCVQLSSQTKD